MNKEITYVNCDDVKYITIVPPKKSAYEYREPIKPIFFLLTNYMLADGKPGGWSDNTFLDERLQHDELIKTHIFNQNENLWYDKPYLYIEFKFKSYKKILFDNVELAEAFANEIVAKSNGTFKKFKK